MNKPKPSNELIVMPEIRNNELKELKKINWIHRTLIILKSIKK